jgi:hypothetical protein
MSVIGSNSIASQIYGGVQSRSQGNANNRVANSAVGNEDAPSTFRLPSSATPRGDWVLSEGASPQRFEQNAPRGSYLNVVV